MGQRNALVSGEGGTVNGDVPDGSLVIVVAQRVVLSITPLQEVRTGGQRVVEGLTADRVVHHDASLLVDSEVESIVVGLCVDSADKRDPTVANELIKSEFSNKKVDPTLKLTYVDVGLQDSSDTVLALDARLDAVAKQKPAALVAVRDSGDVAAVEVSVGTLVSHEDFGVGGPSRLK